MQHIFLSLTERCKKNAREIRQTTIRNGAQQRSETYKPDTDVLEAFQDLGWLDMGILGTAGSVSCSPYVGLQKTSNDGETLRTRGMLTSD